MSNELTITISGPAGSGKSTLATVLSMLLNDFQIPTELKDDNGIDIIENVTVPSEVELERRFLSLVKTGVTAKVRTQLTHR